VWAWRARCSRGAGGTASDWQSSFSDGQLALGPSARRCHHGYRHRSRASFAGRDRPDDQGRSLWTRQQEIGAIRTDLSIPKLLTLMQDVKLSLIRPAERPRCDDGGDRGLYARPLRRRSLPKSAYSLRHGAAPNRSAGTISERLTRTCRRRSPQPNAGRRHQLTGQKMDRTVENGLKAG
jgi:hypothetical protein